MEKVRGRRLAAMVVASTIALWPVSSAAEICRLRSSIEALELQLPAAAPGIERGNCLRMLALKASSAGDVFYAVGALIRMYEQIPRPPPDEELSAVFETSARLRAAKISWDDLRERYNALAGADANVLHALASAHLDEAPRAIRELLRAREETEPRESSSWDLRFQRSFVIARQLRAHGVRAADLDATYASLAEPRAIGFEALGHALAGEGAVAVLLFEGLAAGASYKSQPGWAPELARALEHALTYARASSSFERGERFEAVAELLSIPTAVLAEKAQVFTEAFNEARDLARALSEASISAADLRRRYFGLRDPQLAALRGAVAALREDRAGAVSGFLRALETTPALLITSGADPRIKESFDCARALFLAGVRAKNAAAELAPFLAGRAGLRAVQAAVEEKRSRAVPLMLRVLDADPELGALAPQPLQLAMVVECSRRFRALGTAPEEIESVYAADVDAEPPRCGERRTREESCSTSTLWIGGILSGLSAAGGIAFGASAYATNRDDRRRGPIEDRVYAANAAYVTSGALAVATGVYWLVACPH